MSYVYGFPIHHLDNYVSLRRPNKIPPVHPQNLSCHLQPVSWFPSVFLVLKIIVFSLQTLSFHGFDQIKVSKALGEEDFSMLYWRSDFVDLYVYQISKCK